MELRASFSLSTGSICGAVSLVWFVELRSAELCWADGEPIIALNVRNRISYAFIFLKKLPDFSPFLRPGWEDSEIMSKLWICEDSEIQPSIIGRIGEVFSL